VSKTSHLLLAIGLTLTHVNGFWYFWQNVTDKVSNQKTLFNATPITCASALAGKTQKHENRIFTQILYYCIARIQPAAWFIQSFWLTTHTHAAVWLPKSCNQCAQLGAVGGMVREKGSRESATAVGLCCTLNAAVRGLFGFLFHKVMQISTRYE